MLSVSLAVSFAIHTGKTICMATVVKLDGRSTRHQARRDELMNSAVDYVLREGVSGLSIRPMAEALGISHRTLLHHFGSKEQLIATVLEEWRKRELQRLQALTLDVTNDPFEILSVAWSHITQSNSQRQWRAFFEIYGVAINHPEDYAAFLEGVVGLWLPRFEAALRDWGLPATAAQDYATLILATLRGLVLDLLTSGDEERVTRAFERQLRLYQTSLSVE